LKFILIIANGLVYGS